MKLLKVRLNNFRQHQSSVIDFGDGLTGVIGNNGSGKSTIVEAIAFSLYGSKVLRGKVSDVVTLGLASNSKTSVELTFSHNGHTYRVSRDLNNANLYLGGQEPELVSGNRAVTHKVQEILGLNIEEFLASYYTEQKALEFLSGKKGTSERERFITRMLGYDRLEKIQQLLREDRRDLKNTLQGLSSGLGNKEDILERIDQEKGKFAKQKKEVQAALKALQKAELSEKLIKEEYLELDQISKDYQKHKNQIEVKAISLKKAKEQIAKLEKDCKQLSEVVNAKLEKLDFGKIEDISAKLKELKSNTAKNEKSITKSEKEVEKIINTQREQVNKIATKVAVLENQIKELDQKLKALKKLKQGSDCPTCGQILGEEFKQVADQLSSQKQKHEKDLKAKQEELTSAKKKPKDLSAKQKKIKEAEEQLKQDKKIITEIEDCNKETVQLNYYQEEKERNTKEQDTLTKEIKKAEKDLASLDFNEKEYSQAKAKYEAAKGLVQTSRLQRVKLEGQMNETDALLKRSQEELLEYDQKKADMDAMTREQILLDQSDQVLTDFRKHLNESIRPRLSEFASDFLAELSDGRYTNIHLGDDFSPQVYEDGFVKNVLSGGEEDLINLCLRLALSSLIAERAGHSLSFLILDEVFGSLDENRRVNVLNLLEKLNNRFEQILVITHLDDIKDGVNNLVYVNYDESSGKLLVSNGEQEQDFESEIEQVVNI